MQVSNCQIIGIPTYHDSRGNLSFVEDISPIRFPIKRVYWIYDVPGGEERGGHSFRNTEEFIIAISGSFDVVVEDGFERKVYSLNRSNYGLYIPQGIWRKLENFSTNSLALEFASTHYDEHDYVRDYNEYLELKHHGNI